MRIFRSLFVASAIALALAPTTAAAEDFDDLEHGDPDAWNERWQRFQLWEGITTAALFAEALTVRFGLEWNEDPTWEGGILFDDWASDNFGVYEDQADRSTYDAWVLAGDIPFYGSLAWPVLDPLSVAAIHGDWDAPTQMLLMNLEAYAFYAAALWTTQYVVRRERPSSDALCETQPERAEDMGIACNGADRVRSFMGGHVGAVTLNAALTCMHHGQMDLYGAAGDGVACGAWVAAAGLTFVSRTVTGKHYLTDNVLGAGLGLFSGIAIPYFLHYAHDHALVEDFDDRPRDDGPRVVGVTLKPNLGNRGLELNVMGTL